MKHGMKFASPAAPLLKQRHRPLGSRFLAGIVGIIGMLRAIALEYRTAIAAEETFRRLRFSGGADLALSGLRRDQQALVIKRLYCGHKQ